jgi:hypothetical protein
MSDPIINRYRVRLPLLVHTEDGSYAQGEEFEKAFSEEDERTNVESGLLEIVPRRYKVIGGSVVDGNEPESEFDAAMTIGREALLVAGGHIERVEEKPKAKPRKKKEV